jgi:hypothetical protein
MGAMKQTKQFEKLHRKRPVTGWRKEVSLASREWKESRRLFGTRRA